MVASIEISFTVETMEENLKRWEDRKHNQQQQVVEEKDSVMAEATGKVTMTKQVNPANQVFFHQYLKKKESQSVGIPWTRAKF